MNTQTAAARGRTFGPLPALRMISAALAVALGLLPVYAGAAEPEPTGTEVRVELVGGDVLHGTLVERTDDAIVLEHGALGKVTVSRSAIGDIEPALAEPGMAPTSESGDAVALPAALPTDASDAAAAADVPAESAAEPPVEAAPASAEEPEVEWKGELSVGINGTDGNSDTLNVRIGSGFTRESARSALAFDYAMSQAQDSGNLTENKMRADAKHDWLFDESPWTLFALGSSEFDAFKDYDVRLALSLGPGYRIIEDDRTRLVGRVGLGGSQEIGGASDDFRPEALLGLSLDHALTALQKLTASVEMFPALDGFGEYRLIGRAAWDIKASKTIPWSLRIGFEDRYDSEAATGDLKNDIDYFGSLVRSF